ncbi:hypothetical protein BH09MYX1_BH09MYX1_39310 [soil metagenome]
MRSASFEPDLVAILEAAYAVDRPDQEWLQGVQASVAPAFGGGGGGEMPVGYVYDASTRPIRVTHVTGAGWTIERARAIVGGADDAYVEASYLRLAFGYASEIPGFERQIGARTLDALGIRDVLALNAFDPVGIGCWVGASYRDVPPPFTNDTRERWIKVAVHLTAALRLRLRLRRAERLAAETSEAVLREDGRVDHAGGEAKLDDARASLSHSVRAVVAARTRLRRDSARALGQWKGLVRGRWTRVDHVETGGRRYLVACANAPKDDAPEFLAPRERQVAAQRLRGHSNKLIAYELGLAQSTVRVLVARMMVKLGVRTRSALLDRLRGHALGSR